MKIRVEIEEWTKLIRERDKALAELHTIRKTNEASIRIADERLKSLEIAEVSITGAYREAASAIKWHDYEDSEGKRWTGSGDKSQHRASCIKCKVANLTPPAAIHAEKLLVAQAVASIETWWADRIKRYLPRNASTMEIHLSSEERRDAASAALEEIKKIQRKA